MGHETDKETVEKDERKSKEKSLRTLHIICSRRENGGEKGEGRV
jgi:hypothetical protein